MKTEFIPIIGMFIAVPRHYQATKVSCADPHSREKYEATWTAFNKAAISSAVTLSTLFAAQICLAVLHSAGMV